MLNFQMVGRTPKGLSYNFSVDGKGADQIAAKLSQHLALPVRVLFIDVLDQSGRDYDTVLTVDGDDYYANTIHTMVI